jgi:hypothetical protein
MLITITPTIPPTKMIKTGSMIEVSADSVRDHRGIATFWTTSPTFIGMRSLNASHLSRPRSERLTAMKPPTQRVDVLRVGEPELDDDVGQEPARAGVPGAAA